jgi:ATP-dependent DNA helicase RecG
VAHRKDTGESMTSAFEKLDKILLLEQEQNHRDKAVIGGLARFADNWREQAQREIDDEVWIDQIAQQMRAYSQLTSQEDRRASLDALRESLSAAQTSGREPLVETRSESIKESPPSASRHRPEPAAEQAPQKQPGYAQQRNAAGLGDIGLDSPVTVLSGIGPTQSRRLARLGIHTIREMLYTFPRRYDDFSTLKTINQLEYGEEVTIMGQVQNVTTRRTHSGKVIVKAIIEDGSGTIETTWFNRPHLGRQLKPMRQLVLSGKVDEYMGRLTFQSPEWEPLDRQLLHTARLVPIYPLTQGLSARWMRKTMKRTVDYWSHRMPDHLPEELRERVGLLDLESALRQVHFPDDPDQLKRARYRLAFDEFFIIQIGVLRQRHEWQSVPGQVIAVDDDTLGRFVLSLPFTLTSAQQRALGEIIEDLGRDRPMNRLLQGDVGSGKTVVAAAAMALTTAAGAQTALMAPTEILAEQHYRTISRILGSLDEAQSDPTATPTVVRLLTGSTPPPEKDAIYQGLADGSVDVVVGTHALIQEGVTFQDLALAITDEQHRFGVAQRAALRQKGYNPHVLVMTATPIPRSLALTVYGDLDLSIIDEMPPGRRPVRTRWLLPTERERAYSFVRNQVERGRQGFIICPLVEESAKVEARAAVEEHRRLQDRIFPNLQLGLLHGRMKSEDKEDTMARFVRGELDILVSTSVVEVGIDVPNASVMLIEGANRFGLAQLHQFRGRVGRGEYESYCLLIADSTTAASEERLKAVEDTHDGFVLAEKDLELRGPGEFFGTRQSGLPDLKVAGMADVRLLEIARAEAQRLFEADPELSSPNLRLLVQQVDRFWEGEGDVS